MKISELVKALEKIVEEHGDIEVKTQTLTHHWEPEPTVKRISVGTVSKVYVLLNP